MPLYELFVISTKSATDVLKKTMTFTGNVLLDKGLLIRKIVYMGTRQLPYKMKVERSNSVTQGEYWAIYFYAGSSQTRNLRNCISECKDIVRFQIIRKASSLKTMTLPLN